MEYLKKTRQANKTPLILALVALGCIGAGAQEYLSPCDIDRSADGKMLYVTAGAGKKVLWFDVAAEKVVREADLGKELTGLIPSADGKLLYVTGGGPQGMVMILSAQSGDLQKTIPVGHTPMAPVLSPDGKTLYVCNRFSTDVAIVDLQAGETVARIPVVREPVAAAITPDGKFLFVANHIPDGAADQDYVAAKISVIDIANRKVTDIALVNGAQGLRDLILTPDGKYVLATHLMSRFLVPTTQLERGWINTDAISVIRVSDQSLQYTALLDDIGQGFANPWAMGISDDGDTLLVSSVGNHEISRIDLPGMLEKMQSLAGKGEESAQLDAHNDLSFLAGLRERLHLQGKGPRALVVVGQQAFVANYFSDSIERLDFSMAQNSQTTIFPLGPEQAVTLERQGEIFFNDASLCFEKWLSCATCHPDARTDALNWDLLNDGIGNPKNVKSMLLAHETPPAMWLGVRADAETAVRAGMRHIQFVVRPEEDALAIDAYLKSLTPVPSPYLVDGKLSESAQRGKEVFESSSCARCHPAPLFTNGRTYGLDTPVGEDVGREVDTPSLVEVWRTAPYLHDGRAATLRDVFTTHKHPAHNDKPSKLTDKEIDDLVEYVLSL